MATSPASEERASTVRSRSAFRPAAVACGNAALASAAAPDTCGVAIEVPSRTLYPLAGQVERIEAPGAARSTVARPTFENQARASRLSVAATETTLGSSMPEG